MNNLEFTNKVLGIAKTIEMSEAELVNLKSQLSIVTALAGLQSAPYLDRLIEKVKHDIKANLYEINAVNNLEKFAR
ncbi:hypothetical protein [Vibrio vulnificus]|uniref:hypothetical protein n=1 Tax=Vibrio vulnificus TaxID=672 RepID=UPI00324260D6